MSRVSRLATVRVRAARASSASAASSCTSAPPPPSPSLLPFPAAAAPAAPSSSSPPPSSLLSSSILGGGGGGVGPPAIARSRPPPSRGKVGPSPFATRSTRTAGSMRAASPPRFRAMPSASRAAPTRRTYRRYTLIAIASSTDLHRFGHYFTNIIDADAGAEPNARDNERPKCGQSPVLVLRWQPSFSKSARALVQLLVAARRVATAHLALGARAAPNDAARRGTRAGRALLLQSSAHGDQEQRRQSALFGPWRRRGAVCQQPDAWRSHQ